VRIKIVLITMGVLLAGFGLWVSTRQVQVNLGNRCGPNGCGDVSGNLPTTALGVVITSVGLVAAAYGLTRGEDDQG
jgi:hypothetical protein